MPGPRWTRKAKDDYRERVATLEAALAAAEARRDEEGAAAAREELEFVRRELSSAVGIGGRDRETGSHAERARINVTRAIRSTLKRIAGYDERLGAELEPGVRTGTFCVYRPDPLHPLPGPSIAADRQRRFVPRGVNARCTRGCTTFMRSSRPKCRMNAANDHTFLFADLVGYTSFTERVGDDAAADVAVAFQAGPSAWPRRTTATSSRSSATRS